MYQLGKDAQKNCDIIKDYRTNGFLGCFDLKVTDEAILNKSSEEELAFLNSPNSSW